MIQNFKDKTVIITGGGSGIGREMANQLSQLGANLIIADRNRASAEKVLKEVRAKNGQIEYHEGDLTDQKYVKKLIESVVKKHGRLDFMINGVGIVQGGEVADTPLADWYKVIDTNLHSTMNGTHFAYQQMVKQGFGHIVNFGSGAGLVPTPIMSIYTASKYGIVGFSHALRAEAAEHGVKVSVVCPGFVRTPIYEKALYSGMNKDKTLELLFHKFPIQEPQVAVKKIIAGISKNKMTIQTWRSIYFVWLLYRLSPVLYLWFAKKSLKAFRAELKNK